MQNSINRREFIKSSSRVIAAGALLANLPGIALGAVSDDRLMRHRFGLNYVPSQNWYFCWNDWKPDDIAHDFDRIAAVGADHIRIMLIWPWFQPNPIFVSPVHLDRLEELMRLAAERKLDVLVTIFTGFLSGYHFSPPYLEGEPFFTSPKWSTVQSVFLTEVSKRLVHHPNFLGYDVSNEIDCNWLCSLKEGDVWMEAIFKQMRDLCAGCICVNGVDHRVWFNETSFTPQALVAEQEIVALHCWPFWTGAGKYGGHLDVPYTHLPAAMAALARSYGKSPNAPIWIEEFGACSAEMPEADVPKWMEKAVTSSVQEGVSWFTWWASHDVDRRFEFNNFEYTLGLMTVDNQIKDQGRMFKELADTYRGQPVTIPSAPSTSPPAQRTDEATWKWMLDWMKGKAT